MGCAVYASKDKCEKCYSHKYYNAAGLNYNDKCLNVDVVIDNCKYYNTD